MYADVKEDHIEEEEAADAETTALREKTNNNQQFSTIFYVPMDVYLVAAVGVYLAAAARYTLLRHISRCSRGRVPCRSSEMYLTAAMRRTLLQQRACTSLLQRACAGVEEEDIMEEAGVEAAQSRGAHASARPRRACTSYLIASAKSFYVVLSIEKDA